jgi:hypothetical protein
VVDVRETPATPPFDGKGDDRTGLLLAGASLVVLGWFLGMFVNVLLHWEARSGAYLLWTVHIGYAIGPYAWAVFGLGLVTGALGAGILVEAQYAPKGPLVLPGQDY